MSDGVYVLYVGRDPEVGGRVASALESRDSTTKVRTTTDAAEALDRLEKRPVDCLVSAYRLDDRTGIELLREVRESFPDLPYVLFAEACSADIVREAVATGATEYVPRDPDDDECSLLADRVLEAVRRRRDRERARELERISAVVRDLNRELVRASSREEIDRRVCEIISRSEPYRFAWIGELESDRREGSERAIGEERPASSDPEENVVTGRAAAGVEEGYLEEITITTDPDEATAQGPTGKAVRTHELQVMQNIPEDPDYEPWREEALERGYRSSAAVPLVYDDTLYGVLNVYADRVGAFDDEEQELLEELGDTIAYALHEVELHREARRFHRAVEAAADAIFITDVDGTIEYVNPAFEELTGYSSSAAVGRNPRILKSGEMSDEYYDEMWGTILAGEIWESEIVNERKGGEQYHAEQTIAPIADAADETEGFVAIQRDVTERKESERALRRSRERLRVLFDEAPDGIAVHDVDGNVVDANETLLEWLGYDRDELLSMTVFDFEVGVDEERLRERWQSMDPGAMHKIEVDGAHRRKDGSTYPVEVWVSKVETREEDRFVAIARDVTERKKRQRELERYEHLWRNLPVGVCRIDPEGEGRFLEVNEQLLEIVGVETESELLEYSVADFWEDETARERLLERIEEVGRATVERRFRTLEGNLVWLRLTVVGREGPDGTLILDAAVQDVTDRRQEEVHLEKAQSIADIGSWYRDLETERIEWSDEVYEIFGHPRDEEVTHETFIEYVHPDDREFVERKWEAALDGEPYDIEHRIVTGAGETRWVREVAEVTFDDDGEPISGTGVVQDITERKEREQTLKEREEQYEAVIENVHDGLVIVQDERIQYVNSRVTEMMGYSTEELIGKPVTTFVSEEYEELVLDRHRARLRGEEVEEAYEIDVVTKDGELVPVELSVGVFEYEGGAATITAMRDISERVDRTRQLRVLDRVLRHNLRNDMTTIQGYAETIESEVEEVAEEAEMIIEKSRQLMRTVDKEREIVEVIAERPERREVDVADVCRRVVDAADEAHPDAEIDLDLPGEATAAATREFGRAIEELLENALVHSDRETPEVSLAVERGAETVRIEIVDDGPGIPEEEVNVLTREYEVEPLYHGSGLGLWLVNWIVRQSGGTLDFEENEPRGSVVTIELPRTT